MNPSMHQAKILIVDDEPVNILLLERLLERTDAGEIVSTTDPAKALALFQRADPDVVLLDLHMPGMSGLDVLSQIRGACSSDDYRPVIILTSDVTQEARKTALEAGASDFIAKPLSADEVLLRIGNFARTRRLHVQLQRQMETLEHAVEERTAELQDAFEKLKTAQEKEVQQERLRALSVMASGVVHDFNNSLTIIQGFGELTLRDLRQVPGAEACAEQLEVILQAAKDGAAIVERLREFHRVTTDAEPLRPAHVNALIKEAISFTKPRWHQQSMADGIKTTVRADLTEVPQVLANGAELREAFTNLIFNALDAMPEGGTINFSTRNQAESVEIVVSDTGAGMPEDVRRRCMEPFFSTKGERGSGLGLAMVAGIIQRHGGQIRVESEPGRGTSFIMRIPAMHGGGSSDESSVADVAMMRPLRILLAEDESVVSGMIERYLSMGCHQVVAEPDGLRALETFGRQPFDLVITDRAMPEMNGLQLAAAIRERAPSTPIILLTGFDKPLLPEDADHFDVQLKKPFTTRELRQAIADAFDPAPISETPLARAQTAQG